MARRYLRRTFRIPTAEEDCVVAALDEQGSRGMEVRSSEFSGDERVDVVAYFDGRPSPHRDLPDRPGSVRDGVSWVEETWIEDADWLAAYRERARPFEVGERFRIDPREPGESGTDDDRIELRIPARVAFGTGSHPSTRLILRWLERSPPAGRSVLDVGCGSGILALAARALGADPVVGLDRDVGSALVAGGNARLNAPSLGLPGRESRADIPGLLLFAGPVGALGPGRFDRILVNVLPRRIAGDLRAIADRAHPEGRVVLSGLVEGELAEVEERWEAEGWTPVERSREEEWVSLVLEAVA